MKNKGGRPQGAEPTAMAGFSLTLTQINWIERKSKELGISKSLWVRICIEQAMVSGIDAVGSYRLDNLPDVDLIADDDDFKLPEPDAIEQPRDRICGWCNGSGEGMHEGWICQHCKGKGTVFE